MTYAVIETGGKQHKVEEGEICMKYNGHRRDMYELEWTDARYVRIKVDGGEICTN